MTGEIKFPKPPSIQRDLQGYLLAPVELKTLIEFVEKTEEAKTEAKGLIISAKDEKNPWTTLAKILEMLKG